MDVGCQNFIAFEPYFSFIATQTTMEKVLLVLLSEIKGIFGKSIINHSALDALLFKNFSQM